MWLYQIRTLLFSGVWSTACKREKEKQNFWYEVKFGESCLQSSPPDSVPSGRERGVQRRNRECDSVCKGKWHCCLCQFWRWFFGKQEALQGTTRLSWDSSILVQLHDLPNLTYLLTANKGSNLCFPVFIMCSLPSSNCMIMGCVGPLSWSDRKLFLGSGFVFCQMSSMDQLTLTVWLWL